MKKKAVAKEPYISICGICCSLCPPYKNKDCPGCHDLPFCKIHQCARQKLIAFCFDCTEFPCLLFKQGFDWNLDMFPVLQNYHPGVVKWKPYSDTYIHYFQLIKDANKQKK